MDFCQNFQSIFQSSNLQYFVLIIFKFSLVIQIHDLSENLRQS